MEDNLPKEVCDLLEKTFEDKMDNFKITVHDGNEKGAGYLGELLFISLENKKQTGNIHQLVIKQATAGNYPREFVSATYNNEINFYTKIWPTIDEFQKTHRLDDQLLNHTAKCYANDATAGAEKLILDNLKFKNYQLHPKSVPLDAQQIEEIFKLYGKYHGISFALGGLKPKKLSELSSLMQNNWETFFKMFPGAVGIVCSRVNNLFDPKTEKHILEKFKKYKDNGNDIVLESMKYSGAHPVILHGDCWSNNIMFKYNENHQVEDLKMIDFQMSFLGSPVHDLSYSIYSGAGKESLDCTEKFLKIYYKSLGETLQAYGCIAEKMYPYDVLKSEWKNYCRFGFIVGLLVLSAKENANQKMKCLVTHMYEKQLL